jgi:GNAT superfamily N-acetyltransferase
MTEPVSDRLAEHLRSWVGAWPPPAPGITVIGDAARMEPTWDGVIRPLQGVGNGEGTVIAVPPDAVDRVSEVLAGGSSDPTVGDRLGEILGVGSAAFGAGVFRSVDTIDAIDPAIADVGEWYERQIDGLPEWLAPFNGPRLVARDRDGRPIAGVGIKIHDRRGHELAVVTMEAARGRGLARGLVATAARRVLEEGAVATYLHDPNNTASARVAEAVGFADRGWSVHGLWPRR